MVDLQSLIHEVDELTPDEIRQLYAHIKEAHKEIIEQQPGNAVKPRILGLHAGKMRMSDDFDEELPDSFWLGEE